MKKLSLLKIIIPLTILMLLGTGVLVATKLSQKSQDLQSQAATDQIPHSFLTFKTNGAIEQGKNFNVSVILNTSQDPDFVVTGVDLVLPFPDESIVQPVSIQSTKDAFNMVSRKEVNTKDKKIYFSASVNNLDKKVLGAVMEINSANAQWVAQPDNFKKLPQSGATGLSGQVVIATITFKALQAGSFSLTPVFDSASSTTDTNLIGFEKNKPTNGQVPRERLLVKPEPITLTVSTELSYVPASPRPSPTNCVPRPDCSYGYADTKGNWVIGCPLVATVNYCPPDPGFPKPRPTPISTTPPRPVCPSIATPANFCADGIMVPGTTDKYGCQQPPTCKTSTITTSVTVAAGSPANLPVALYISGADAQTAELAGMEYTNAKGRVIFNVTAIAKKYAYQPVYLYYATPNYFPVRLQSNNLDVSAADSGSARTTNKVSFTTPGDIYVAPDADLPDGAINTFDALELIRLIGQKTTTFGDLNHDGVVNTADLRTLLKYMGKQSPVVIPPRPQGTANPFTAAKVTPNTSVSGALCNNNADCGPEGQCYQPPMPPCPEGMGCIQVMPHTVCR